MNSETSLTVFDQPTTLPGNTGDVPQTYEAAWHTDVVSANSNADPAAFAWNVNKDDNDDNDDGNGEAK